MTIQARNAGLTGKEVLKIYKALKGAQAFIDRVDSIAAENQAVLRAIPRHNSMKSDVIYSLTIISEFVVDTNEHRVQLD